MISSACNSLRQSGRPVAVSAQRAMGSMVPRERDPKNDAVIVGIARTPVGKMGGGLASLSATKLGSITIRAALARAGLTVNDVQEAFFGNVVQANLGQAPARQSVLGAELPKSVPCTTVNKVCASGMKAAMFAAQLIQLGTHECVLAGGFESMSNVPYYVPKGRNGYRLGHGEFLDGILKDGLTDVYSGKHMGNAGEVCAERYGFSKDDQDAYAIESYKRAMAARDAGILANEIVPVSIPQRRGDAIVVQHDEEIAKVDLKRISTARPAFKRDNGTVTAANASSINDGAATLVITSMEKAKRAGLKPLARILHYGDAACEPLDFTIAPSLAVPKVLGQVGLSTSDIDLWEINEAFSVVVQANMKILGLDHDKVNVFGGAVSIGHPIGCSGARILGTLVNALQTKDKTLGMAAICNGGGGASALVLERLN